MIHIVFRKVMIKKVLAVCIFSIILEKVGKSNFSTLKSLCKIICIVTKIHRLLIGKIKS